MRKRFGNGKQKLNESRQEGCLAGREEKRGRLRRLAEQRFDAATANALDRLFNAADERREL